MDYLTTFYIGCEDNGEVASPGIHGTTYLTQHNTQGHMELMNIVSNPFVFSQFMYEMKVLDGPLKYCFLIDKKLEILKWTENHIETQLDSIKYFINSYQPPTNGIIISLYFIDRFKYYQSATLASLWPFKQDFHWLGDGDYITFHDYESNTNHYSKVQYLNSPVGKIAQEIEKHSIHPVKRINYAMGDKKIFEILKHTKFHISYAGATYHSGGIIKCPTIGIYWNYHTKKLYKDRGKTFTGVSVEIGVKESFDQNTEKGFFTYDFENNCLVKRHQDYLKHCTNENEFMAYLKGASVIRVQDKVYETV